MSQVNGTDYRGHYIVKHEPSSKFDYVHYSVVLGGIVWTHYSMPLAMDAIDRWYDED